MARLETKGKYRNHSKRGKRFYTMLDMALIKKAAAIVNSVIKRGEIEDKPNNYISDCGCGFEGCFIHGAYDNK